MQKERKKAEQNKRYNSQKPRSFNESTPFQNQSGKAKSSQN